MSYDIGDSIRLYGEFKTEGNLVDPAALRFKFKIPTGSITSYVFGIDPEIVKDAVGQYHVDMRVYLVGMHFYRWETDTPYGAEEAAFKVVGSQFPAPSRSGQGTLQITLSISGS